MQLCGTLSKINVKTRQFVVPASWSSGNAFVSGAGGPRFKCRVGQIGRSVANGLPPQRHKKVQLLP